MLEEVVGAQPVFMLEHLWTIADALFSHIAKVLVVIFCLTKTRTFQNIMVKGEMTYQDKGLLILLFSAIAILGTNSGVPISGALANTRAIGIIVAGLVGGPLVGTGAGFIAGMHRWYIGGFTVFSSSLSSVVEGILAGLIAEKFAIRNPSWRYGLFIGAGLEILHMIILLLCSGSYHEASLFVQAVGPSMVVMNAAGVAIIMAIIARIFEERERAQALAAHLALRIADKTTAFLRQGLTRDAAAETVRIIRESVDSITAVAITSRDQVLAFRGAGEEHHSPSDVNDSGLFTESTKQVIRTGKYSVVQQRDAIGCLVPGCPLASKVVVPLKERGQVIGSIMLYRSTENGITPFETELALGLGTIISTQLALSNSQRQRSLLAQAEIKALQAQINPHFLFNALNTIVYYCDKQPQTAKKLLIHLANFYRGSLARTDHFTDLATELEHVDAYVQIEMARFGKKLKVCYNIKPDCQCQVPPLIVQPIVENAIKHGIYPKRQGGSVVISAQMVEEKLLLMVEDDGIGMSEAEIARALEPNPARKSIGLLNVSSRLKSIYRGEASLTITSELGKGTCVSLRIPAREGREAIESISG